MRREPSPFLQRVGSMTRTRSRSLGPFVLSKHEAHHTRIDRS
jgi:hypothetical protein